VFFKGELFSLVLRLEQTGKEDAHWIHLAQDTDQWTAVVNTVMNLHGP